MPKLKIDKLAFGGAGFGRLDGKACFVPYTAPGDTVDIAISRDKSSYLEGVIDHIESPAGCRVPPICPVFGICGGCDWQHVSYDSQCRQKELIFTETMWRMARLEKEVIRPLIPAHAPYGYRQRIQLKVHCAGGEPAIGFYRPGSHYVVDLPSGCAIARPELNNALNDVRWIVSSAPDKDKIPQVDLSAGENGAVTALFHYIGRDPKGMTAFLSDFSANLKHITAISLQNGRKDTVRSVFGPEKMEYTLTGCGNGNLSLSYSADSFSQVNFSQNRCMVELVSSWVMSRKINDVLDLFCGNGNFSLPLADCVGSTLGLESYARSIELARDNACKNGIVNARFLCEDSSRGVTRLANEGRVFDLILLDPPRSGADAVVRNLNRLQPACLAYVSCDPPTLGRDLALLQKNGFRVELIQPVDMFPQTYHLESVTFLQAN